MSLLDRISRALTPNWLASSSAPESTLVPAVSNSAVVSTGNSAAILELFGINTNNVQSVTPESSMRVATAYRCTNFIAGAVQQLPRNHFSFDPKNGNRTQIFNTKIWWLLNERPHARWSAAAWFEYIVTCILLRGDAYAELVRDKSGVVVGIRPLLFHQVYVRHDYATDRLVYLINYYGKMYGRDQDDILHFHGFGFDGVKAMSVIAYAAKQSIGNALAAGELAGKAFSEGLMPQIALEYPNKLSPDQAEQLRTSFAKTYGAAAGYGARKLPLVVAEGGKVNQLSLTPEDAQMMDSRKFDKADICTAFGVPPVMIGDNEKTSSWGTGIEQITIGFVRYTLMPILSRIREELNSKLFAYSGQFIDFDTDALTEADLKTQAAFFRAALGGPGTGNGWMSINEVRRRKMFGPVADGDEIFKADATKPAPASEPKAPGETDDGGEGEPKTGEDDAKAPGEK